MASEFTLSGMLRLDCDLTNTQSIGGVTDTSAIYQTFALANGTGANQANIYVRKTGSVAASANDITTLSSVSVPTQSGTTYTASIDKIRVVYFKNTSATRFVQFSLTDTAGDPYWAAEVHPGGVLFWTVGASTVEVSPGSVAIDKVAVYGLPSNAGAATYEMLLVGTKA